MNLRQQLDRLVAQRKLAHSQITSEQARLSEAKEEVTATLQAQDIIQKLAQEVQNQAHQQVAKVVSQCLSAVFKEPYELKIEFVRRRGKTEADFAYYRDGNRVNPRVTSGGVMEVVSMALRLISMILTLPPGRRLLVLDEPFRALSESNLQKMALLIETLSRELGVQFIISTHDETLQIGKVIRL